MTNFIIGLILVFALVLAHAHWKNHLEKKEMKRRQKLIEAGAHPVFSFVDGDDILAMSNERFDEFLAWQCREAEKEASVAFFENLKKPY
jgi:hypothetical protein